MIFLFLSVFLFTTGCSGSYFYAQQQRIDKNHLASAHVHTPDPRQSDPPTGEALLVSWDFPMSVFEKNLTLLAKVRLWNTEEELILRPIVRKRDTASFFFPNRQILTYLIQAVTPTGEVVSEWEHQFWTEWIDIE
jgi:hypothetical protein